MLGPDHLSGLLPCRRYWGRGGTAPRSVYLRRAVPVLLGIVLLCACTDDIDTLGPRATPPPTHPPAELMGLACPECNVILLNIELLRADHIGLLNPGEPSVTPNIDRFFEQSLVFGQVSAPAGESYRSNLSVLTAAHSYRYPAAQTDIDRFAKRSSNESLETAHETVVSMLTRYTTMPEVFRAHGYFTVGLNQGIRAGKYLLLDRGLDRSVDWERFTVPFRETVEVLEQSLKTANSKFFLLYRPEVLHPFPYYFPDDLPRIDFPGKIHYSHRPRLKRYNVRFENGLSVEEKRQTHRAIYRQQLGYVDSELENVFSVIRDRGLEENSVIVLYSNHGSGLGDNGVHRLAVSYQSCIHVPLMIRIPSLERQVRIDTPVSLIDLAPTLFEITRIDDPRVVDGRSLLSRTSNEEETLVGRNDVDEYIRMGALKLIIKNGESRELYDLAADPHEESNLASTKPDLVRALESRLLSRKIEILGDVSALSGTGR